MIFSCEKENLQNALNSCVRAVSSNTTTEVLKGLLISAENEQITITGNNYEMGIICTIPADVQTPGDFILEAKIFADIVRKLPDDTIKISVNEKHIATITCGKIKFTLVALPPENYPELPQVEGLKKISIKQSLLKKLINSTIFAVSYSDIKTIHNGVLFEIENNNLTVVALDKHRMAVLTENELELCEDTSFVIPATTLRELERLLSDDEELNICIHISSQHILFDTGNVTIVSRLLDGAFTKYKNVIPKNATFCVTLNKRDVINSIERIALLVNEKLKTPIELLFENDQLNISTKSSIGDANETIECTFDGTIEIGMNHKYLLDALKHVDSDNVKIETSGGKSPLLLLPDDNENVIFLVLPVTLNKARQ